MNFPDLPHVKQLQNDLWQWPRSRAAIMVGAGLSLNAEPLPGIKKRFPTWWELVRCMFDELHPPQPDEIPQDREARLNRASPLRVASEYDAAFGRRKLDNLIRAEIPDSGYRPGSLHRLLLELPWVDVFTTNYDTLLERTEVDGRTYQPVSKAGELTTAFAPRIVKLHGSFPSQTPFIITEEDFRTYPRNFAPFVNSVQQSLLENSFVLVGFSGDDPNFLAWTGWIRDELGENHAPIYLVGGVPLGDAERSLLAKRGVRPIDLSPVLGKSPAPNRHAAAIEWFLNGLAAARPPRPEKWPNLRPIFVSMSGIPIADFTATNIPDAVPFPDLRKPLVPETFAHLMKRWQFERSSYPGWIVAQVEKRLELWRGTERWLVPLFKFAKNSSPVDCIFLFREVIWRLEISMVPLLTDWIEPFREALDNVFNDIANNRPLQPSPAFAGIDGLSGVEVADAWLAIAFGLLRDARESYDAPLWTALKAKIDIVVEQHQRHTDRNYYEAALWAMWNVERGSARNILSQWQPSQSPLARMWKAGLMAELDEVAEAKTLLRTALMEIRKALRNQGQSRELLSLEGWCTYLIQAVELSLDLSRISEVRDEFWERWEELKAWDCSPWPYKKYFDEVLSAPPPKFQKHVEEVRGFDPGEMTISLHFLGSIEPFLPGFACIRLFEQVGIPMRLPMVDVAGECLRNACSWVAPLRLGFWSPALLIRAGRRNDLTKSDFLARTQVYVMEPALAKRLYSWCQQILIRELRPAAGLIVRNSSEESLLEVCPEVLSRLAFKLDVPALRTSFPLALQCHRLPAARLHPGIYEACMNWFKRLFEAADDELLLEWLPDLIRESLLTDGFHPVLQGEHGWPDPIRYFPVARLRGTRDHNPDTLAKIRAAAEWLLRRAASESGAARHWSILRLIFIYEANLMTAEQSRQMGELLWDERANSGLPDIPSLNVSGLLNLPAPPNIDVTSIVKSHILNLTSEGDVNRDPSGARTVTFGGAQPLLRDATLASKPVVQQPREQAASIDWTQEEAKQLFHKALAWWDNDKAAFEVVNRTAFNFADPVLQNLKILNEFLARVVVPRIDSADESEWQKLVTLLQETRTAGGFPTALLPYMLIHRPGDSGTVAQSITDDLYSDTRDAVPPAATAVRNWIHLSDLAKIPAPPPIMIAALVERVIFRRNPGVASCLAQLALLIAEKPQHLNPAQAELLTASLVPWHHASILPVPEAAPGDFSEAERPELRVLLGRLAGSLSVWRTKLGPESPEPAALALWRDLCASDSLPEVRRAFGFATELNIEDPPVNVSAP